MKIASMLSRALLAQRRLVGLGPQAQVVRSGLNWNLDLREGIDLSIYLFGRFDAATARAYGRLLRSGDIVLDIGANIGAHTLQLAKCVAPSGRVIAAEPTAYAFSKLVELIQNNRPLSDIVTAHQVMLTHSSSATLAPELYSSWSVEAGDAPQHALHGGTGKSTAGARSITLDELVTSEKLSRVDLIKMDVDGWEMDVLRGAKDTLGNLKPPIVFELAPYVLEERGHSALALLEELAGYGYRFSELRGGEVHDWRGLAQRIPFGAGHNLIARAR